MILTLIDPSFEALAWEDNCGEIKRFCGEDATITYEVSVEEFWNLQIYDRLKERKVTVALHDYVVKIPGGVTVVSKHIADTLFNVTDK